MKHGINRENLDVSKNPAEDFYGYANGGWQKANPLKPDFSIYGVFDQLHEKSREQLRELFDQLAADPESKVKGTPSQKICDIYAMALDMDTRNSRGVEPLKPLIGKIRGLRQEDFYSFIADPENMLSGTFFSCGVSVDRIDSNRHIAAISECGLGLGDRDYYLVKSEENDRILAAYEIYIKRLLELTGHTEAERQRVWETLIKMETAMAGAMMTKEEWRDPLKSYNMMSLEEVKEKYPAIDWDTYLGTLGLGGVTGLNVMSPGFFEFINRWLPMQPWQDILDILELDYISASSGLLTLQFREADFEMFGKVMSGQQEMKPLWKAAMGLVTSMFSELVGQIYVKKYFPEENKKYMTSMVENLRSALGEHISGLTWMSDATKAKALEKLAALKTKIGYPDKWKDYKEIEIDPELGLVENVRRAAVWFVKDSLSKINKPVDKEEWHMAPQAVNAYYSPIANEICFPAGILQPPFFDITADDAVNYGGIGVVIGHEMTHGFDDQGRKFDKDGNMTEWWTEADAEAFNKLTAKLVEQFDAVEVAPGVHANGTYTLGENIADQGGLRIARTAWKKIATESGSDVDDGFTPEQRFYLSYANVWATNIRPEEVLRRTQNDPHSLSVNRVNITLRNITPFIDCFSIKEGDKMYRPDNERVIIW